MFKPDPKVRKKQLVSFEILVKGVLQSRKGKNGCVCRTYVGCEAGLDLLLVFLFLNKTNLSPDGCSPLTLLVPTQEDLCLFCCLVLLPWAGCWSLNVSPHRGGIFDKANVTKNAPLFHSVPFFACASRPSGISQTAVVCCAQEGLLHPSRAMDGCFLVSLARFLGLLGELSLRLWVLPFPFPPLSQPAALRKWRWEGRWWAWRF